MPTGRLTYSIMSKRKNEDELDADEKSKKQRHRTRSRSEPLPEETDNPEKREVLKRLFGRYCSIEDNHPREAVDDTDDDDFEDVIDENEDPLLDTVPVNLDPEQLGFLLCAQETLRFLHGRGITAENPMFMRLRSRLIQGIADIAAA